MNLLVIGACILMGGTQYKIADYGAGTYVLEQKVVVFEENRTYQEQWKQSWINTHSKTVKCEDE
jgi:hypothetical protein